MELNKADKKLIDELMAANAAGAKVHDYHVTEIAEFNHLDLGFYKKKTEEASESSFEWLFDIESPTIDGTNNMRTAIRLLSPKNRQCICAVYHAKPNLFLRFIALVFRMGPLKIVEFETQFTDDTFVVTSTAKLQAGIYKPPQIAHHHVKDGSFNQLFKWHQQHIELHLAESTDREVMPQESLEVIIQAQQTMDKYKIQHQQDNNYLDPSQIPKSISKDPEHLAAVLRYAQLHNPEAKKQQQKQLQKFEQQLTENGLKFKETAVIPIEDFNKYALAVKTDIRNAVKDRLKLQSHFKGSHYPVIIDFSDFCDDFETGIENMAVLSRYPFETEMEFREQDTDVKYDPDSLIAQSQSIDLDAVIEPIIAEQSEFYEDVIDEVKYELEVIERIFGSAPKLSSFKPLIESGKLSNQTDLQKILLSWILKNHRDAALELSKDDINSYAGITSPKRHPPDTQSDCAIVLVPVSDMSEVPAFIHWQGSDQIGSAATCKLLRQWQTKYQAQLVAVEASSLEFYLPKPIGNIKEAFEMAVLHNALAPSMLGVSGNSVWHYAITLMRTKNWCLWDTP